MSTTAVNTFSYGQPPTASTVRANVLNSADHELYRPALDRNAPNKAMALAWVAGTVGTIAATIVALDNLTIRPPNTTNALRVILGGPSFVVVPTPQPTNDINPTWPTDVQRLAHAICEIFSNAELSLERHTDADERWTRHVLSVESGLSEEERIAAEDIFYTRVDRSETLQTALASVIVTFS